MAVLQPPPAGGFPAQQVQLHAALGMVSFQMGTDRSFEYWHMAGLWWWSRPDSGTVFDHPNDMPGWVKVGPPFDPDDTWIFEDAIKAIIRAGASWAQDAADWIRNALIGQPPPVGPDLPDPTDPPPAGGGGDPPVSTPPSPNVQMASAFPAAAGLAVILARLVPIFQRGVRIPWSSIPGWLRTVLVALGFAEGVDIIWDLATGGDVDIPFFGGASSGGDPTTQMVEAMTVSTWEANGVTFHRLSDGRLATRNKHGVWKIWRPKKPIVIFATGVANLPDLLRADRAIDKQAKKIAKTLRNRGYTVRKKTESSS